MSEHDPARQDILAHCAACSHVATLDAAAILARLGDRPLPEIRPLLRCTRCGYDGKDERLGTCAITLSPRHVGPP